MSDTRFTVRLSGDAEASPLTALDEVAARHGMSRSQLVRALINRELKAHGYSVGPEPDEALRTYAAARTDEALFERHRQFEEDHPSTHDARLRPKVPKRPSAMRVRVAVGPDEVIALEETGEPYGMSIQQVATVIVRRWIGLDKRPAARVFASLSGIRAEVRKLGVNVNQIAFAGNKLLNDPRLRRQHVFEDLLRELPTNMAMFDRVMKDLQQAMGLDAQFWSSGPDGSGEGAEPLPHPSLQIDHPDEELP